MLLSVNFVMEVKGVLTHYRECFELFRLRGQIGKKVKYSCWYSIYLREFARLYIPQCKRI